MLVGGHIPQPGGGKMQDKVLFLGLLALVAALPLGLAAQKDKRPEILIVGTYHMANRGHDVYNGQADDVLLPQRQQEIVEVIEGLKKFDPTKIAIEADIDIQSVAQEYSDYLAGKYTLSRDETNQLGYRMAKELGHKSVYPVNAWAGNDFPISHVFNFARANGSVAQLRTVMSKWGTGRESWTTS